MSDVEALIRIRVQSPRRGQVTDADAIEPFPVKLPPIATLAQLVSPDAAKPRSKQRKTVQVSRDGVVVVVASDDLV